MRTLAQGHGPANHQKIPRAIADAENANSVLPSPASVVQDSPHAEVTGPQSKCGGAAASESMAAQAPFNVMNFFRIAPNLKANTCRE